MIRSILLLALVFASIAMIKEVTLTGLIASENMTNSLPVWSGNTTWEISKDGQLTVDLDDYFSDPDYDTLTYLATAADKISIEVINNILTITPDFAFVGERTISILASDEFDAIKVSIKIVIGTEEERALSPIDVTEEINITEESNTTQQIESNASAISALETENRSIKKFDKDENIKDENNKHVGKKIEDETVFETFFTKIQKNETELLVEFYHDSTISQPVWIEGDINYSLSENTAEQFQNITLIVPRVKGIIPKFKLHIGSSSDVFEFGKTIPEVIFNGESTLIDRDDEKIDVKLARENSKAEIKGAIDVEFINAKVTSVNSEIIKTDVFAANNISMDNAIISLQKTGNVNRVLECPDFNTITETCPSSWFKTNIPFEDNGTHITFTVNHFSAYGGGIEVSRAEHLDSNYSFIADVYNEVKAKDNVWTNRINDSQFIRATFERNLTNGRIMDILVRGNGSLEIYIANTNNSIASSGYINSSKMIYLSMENLSSPEDTFDLKTVGDYLEYDFIHDATAVACGAQLNSSGDYILTADASTTTTCFTVAGSNISFDCQGFAIRGDRTGTTDYAFSSTTTNYDNLTIKNCFIYNFSRAIHYKFSNVTFYNNTLNGVRYYTIALYSKGGHNISENNFNSSAWSSSTYAVIYTTTTNDNLIENNYFWNNTGYEIYFTGGSLNKVINNTFDVRNKNKTTIHIDGAATSARFENNTILNQGTGTNSWAYHFQYANIPITFVGNNSVDGENMTDYFIYNRDNLVFENLSRGKTNIFNQGQLVVYTSNIVSIKNSLLENNTGSALNLYDVQNVTVINNTFHNGSYIFKGHLLNNVTIENNTITVGGASSKGALHLTGIDNTTIRNNTIKSTVSNAYGLYIASDSTHKYINIEKNNIDGDQYGMLIGVLTGDVIENVYIKNNSVSHSTRGIGIDQASSTNRVKNAQITNNTINNCSSGIYNLDNILTNITFNYISDCGTGSTNYGIFLGAKSNVTNNTVKNCGSGIHILSEGNNIHGNNLTNNSIWGIQIGSYLYMRNNITQDNTINDRTPYYFYKRNSTIENISLRIGKGVSTGVITFVDVSNSRICNNTIMSNGSSSSDGLAPGIVLFNMSDSIISNNTINSTDYGIYILSDYNTISRFDDNIISNNLITNTTSDMVWTNEGMINTTIKNNTFADLTASGKYAIYLNKPGAGTVISSDINNITSNTFEDMTNGIYIYNGDNNYIEFNTFDNITQNHAIYLNYYAQNNKIRHNNLTNIADSAIEIGDASAPYTKNNSMSFNYINNTDYGINWNKPAANNTAFDNSIYGATTTALYVYPYGTQGAYVTQLIFNNTVCYNTQAVQFGAATFGFENTVIHNNSFCIVNLNPLNGTNTTFARLNVSFNATNVFNLTDTNCTLFIDNTNQGYNESVDDNSNTTIGMTSDESAGWHNLSINCSDARDNKHVVNEIQFEITGLPVQCGDTITSNTTMTENLSSTTTCITIGAHEITLDCAGFVITGNRSASTYAIYSNAYDNLTIKNCEVANYSSGMFISNSENARLINNTARDNQHYGIDFSTVPDSKIENNTVYNNVGANLALSANSNRVTIKNNNLTNSSAGWGIYISSSHNITSENNIAHTSATAYMTIDAHNITFTNDTILGTTSAGFSIRGNSTTITNITSASATTDLNVDPYYPAYNLKIIDSRIGNYNIQNATELVLKNSTTGQIKFLKNLAETGTDLFGATTSDIRLTNATVFVNSSAQPKFNISANITMYGLGFTDSPNIYIDQDGDGVYESKCTAPRCVNLSYSGGTFIFNATHFTFYKADSNSVPTQTAPILNSTYATNLTSENLTVYANVSDSNPDSIKNITTWYLNGSSIMVLNMPFEGGSVSGNTTGVSDGTKDYSSFGNNGTVVNATWNSTGGYDGKGAYQFDGDSDFIDMGGSGFDLTQGTMSAWVYVYDKSVNQVVIGNTYSTIRQGMGIENTVRCNNYNGSHHGASSAISDNTWAHVVCVFTGVGQSEIYVNGVKGTGSNAASVSGTAGTVIGMRTDKTNNPFNGTIDDVMIFNRSLSAQQIKALYENRTDLIVSQETNKGETWKACITPNDGTIDGAEQCSNNVTIANTAPVHDTTPILNSTYATNYTNENLTVYANISDIDNDEINLSINWFRNERSYPATPRTISYYNVVLNMPFENYSQTSDAYKDYSTYENNGTVLGPVWNGTGGYDGYGAYEFDGYDDYINLSNPTIPLGNGTICHWAYFNANNTYQILAYTSDDEGADYNGFGGGGNITEVHTALTNAGQFRFVYQRGDLATGYNAKTSSTRLAINSWYHLCAVYDESSVMTIFIDGVNAGSKTMSTKSFNQSLGSVNSYISKHGNGTGFRHFNGTLDEVLIFNRSLSAEEILNLSQNRSDLIVSQETNKGETWKACVTPNDGTVDGIENCSNNLTIANTAPVHDTTPILNSTFATNYTNENLTVYANVSDIDDDSIKNITTWYLNGSSIMVLNMPFEGGSQNGTAAGYANGTKDYSSFGNNGTVVNATWNSTGGYDGRGAYQFNGSSDYISLTSKTYDLNIGTTFSFWAKKEYPFEDMYVLGSTSSAINRIMFVYLGSRIYLETTTNNDFAIGAFTTGTDWHHYTISCSNYSCTFYEDGIDTTVDSVITDNITLDRIGISGTLNPYNGTLDDILIFNRSLSAEQILALNNSRTDLIVSQETDNQDIWKACVTPNDGTEDGIEQCSNNLTVELKCGQILYEDTVMYQNLSSNGTCFTIGTDDITLDCAGYSIRGNKTGSSINITGANDVKIKNCELINFSNGLNIEHSNSTTVNNITTWKNKEGLRFLYSDNDLINDSVIYNNSNYGIRSEYSDNNTFFNLTVHSNVQNAFWFTYSHHLNITSCIISNSTNNDGISINYESNNTHIRNNILVNHSDEAIVATGLFNSTIKGNYIDAMNHDYGMSIKNDCTNNTIENNIVGNASYSALEHSNRANGNIIANNTFLDSIMGISLFTLNDTTIINNTIKDCARGIMIYAYSGVRNTLIKENTITGSTNQSTIAFQEIPAAIFIETLYNYNNGTVNTIIYNNTIANNSKGIFVWARSGSINITNNRFINNTRNAFEILAARDVRIENNIYSSNGNSSEREYFEPVVETVEIYNMSSKNLTITKYLPENSTLFVIAEAQKDYRGMAARPLIAIHNASDQLTIHNAETVAPEASNTAILSITKSGEYNITVYPSVSAINTTGTGDFQFGVTHVPTNVTVTVMSSVKSIYSIIKSVNVTIKDETISGHGLSHGIYLFNSSAVNITNMSIISSKHSKIINAFDTTFENSNLDKDVIIEGINNGSINFTQDINITTKRTLSDIIEINHETIKVDTVTASEFNKSAVLTLKNLSFINPEPTVNFPGTGALDFCEQSICNEVSYVNNSFVYSVTHFTNFSVQESKTNITVNKSQSSDNPDAGGLLNYNITIIINASRNNATNVTVYETYDTNTAFVTSSPTADNPGSGDNVWSLGNLSNGTRYVLNITVRVNAGTGNGVIINNTVNVTFFNFTGGDESSIILSLLATVNAPAAQIGGGGGGGGATRVIPGGVNYTEPECFESWSCGFWSQCVDGIKTRLCYDLNNCGTENLKPSESASCIPPKPVEEVKPKEAIIEAPAPIKFSFKSKLLSAKNILINIHKWIMDNICFVLAVLTYLVLITSAIFAIIYFLTRNYFEHINKHIIRSYVLVAVAALLLMINYAVCKEMLLPALLAIAGITGIFILDFIVTAIFRKSVEYWKYIKYKEVRSDLKSISGRIKQINKRLSRKLKKFPEKKAFKTRLKPLKIRLRESIANTLGSIAAFNNKLKQKIKRKKQIRTPEPIISIPRRKQEISRISRRLDTEIEAEFKRLKKLHEEYVPAQVIKPESKKVKRLKISRRPKIKKPKHIARKTLSRVDRLNKLLKHKLKDTSKKPGIGIARTTDRISEIKERLDKSIKDLRLRNRKLKRKLRTGKRKKE